MPIDRRGKLALEPFTYRPTKDGKVMVSWGGRVVTTVAGAAAARLIKQLAGADEAMVQLALAKITGHFKRGTERSGDD